MRRWGVATVLLGAALVAAAGIGLASIGPDDIRPRLVDAVQNATGRTLTLGSEMRFTRSLWPTVEVNDVRLSNLPGGSRPQMATAERIVLTLSLPALLQRRIEFTKLVLIGPNILFEQVDGLPNWRFDLPDSAAPAPASASPPFELRILGAQVVNGMVTWRLPNRTKVLGIRSADIHHDRPDGSIQMASTLVYSDYAPFGFTVDASPTGALADPWDTRLGLAAFDTVASAHGRMDTAGHYDLQLDGTSGNLDRLNALLPSMQLPAVQGVVLSTQIGNGRQNGDLPVIGTTRLRFASARDVGIPGVTLGPATIGVDQRGGVATLTGAGHYRTQPVSIDATADIPLYLDGPVSLPVDLKLHAANFDAGMKGKLALRTLVFGGYDGAATLAAPALASLRPIAPGLPSLTGVRLASQIAVPASLQSLSFSGLALRSDQGDIAGSGRAEAGPKLAAKLHAARLDLQAMLAAVGLDGPARPAPPSRTVIPDTPIDWSVLRGPTLDFALTADALGWQNETWRMVALDLQLEGGNLRRANVSLPMGGKANTLSITANAATHPVPVRLSIEAPALPLALLARWAGLPGLAEGTAHLQARLQASGDTLHQLAAALDGTAAVAVVGGQLDNQAVAALVGHALDALGVALPTQGRAALRCLGVQSSFAHGTGRLTTIALETGDLSVEGTGTVDLAQETLSLKIQPLARVAGALVRVPVTVQGPFRSPSGQLDAGGLGKLGIAFGALFGSDDATACKDAGLVPP